MTNEDKKLWEDESPVHVDWFDWVFDIIICILVGGIILFGSFIVTKAEAPGIHTYGPIAGVNRQLIRCIENSDEFLERKARLGAIEKRRQELAQQETAQKHMEEVYISLFGYIPSDTEIEILLRVTMAECGNTEPLDGVERVIEVIANRCRDKRFPSTITEVAYQRNQFETVSTGRIWRYTVNERVKAAWDNVLSRGYCVDQAVAFFTAGGYNAYCRPAYKIGNHYFGY